MQVKNYWRATVKDPESNMTIKIWMEEDTNKVLCLIKKGGEFITTTTITLTTLLDTTLTTSIQTTEIPVTTTTITTTIPVPCSPCFNYFSYIDTNGTHLRIRNGPNKVSLNGPHEPGDIIVYSLVHEYYEGQTRIIGPCEPNWKFCTVKLTAVNYYTSKLIIDTATLYNPYSVENSKGMCSPCFSVLSFDEDEYYSSLPHYKRQEYGYLIINSNRPINVTSVLFGKLLEKSDYLIDSNEIDVRFKPIDRQVKMLINYTDILYGTNQWDEAVFSLPYWEFSYFTLVDYSRGNPMIDNDGVIKLKNGPKKIDMLHVSGGCKSESTTITCENNPCLPGDIITIKNAEDATGQSVDCSINFHEIEPDLWDCETGTVKIPS
jgi:hypothetical protein